MDNEPQSERTGDRRSTGNVLIIPDCADLAPDSGATDTKDDYTGDKDAGEY